MKINNKSLIFALLIYSSTCFGMSSKPFKYGNIEIYNGTNETLVVQVSDNKPMIREHRIVVSNSPINSGSVIEANLPGLIADGKDNYILQIKNRRGDILAAFEIAEVTNKNNIFIDITTYGNLGFRVSPYVGTPTKFGIGGKKSRNGKDLINNVSSNDINAISRYVPSDPFH